MACACSSSPITRITRITAISRRIPCVRSRRICMDLRAPGLRDPAYWNEADLDREMRRVFDVCHTCRMCFSYCPSFPALFDAVDRHEEKGEGEVDALTAEEMEPVVDLCWQCKLCYVKCPYTPPHKFAVDFPRLLQRAKLVK